MKNAEQFALLVKYTVGSINVAFTFADHVDGRIKVFIKGQWAATVVPAGILRNEPTLLFLDTYDSRETEIWGSYQTLANFLSDLSESGSMEEAFWQYLEQLKLLEDFDF